MMTTVARIRHPFATAEEKSVGIRGFEAILFVSIVGIVFVVSLLTTIASLTIIYKLRLFPLMETVTFTENDEIIFHGDADLNRIHLRKNRLNGVSSITGDVSFNVGESYLNLNSDGIEIGSPNGFNVYSSKTGKQIFPPDFSSLPLSSVSSLSVTGGVKNVHKIRSPVDQDLRIESSGKLKIKGNEGVTIDSKVVSMKASSIYLSSINSSVVLDAKEGVYLKFQDPIASSAKSSRERDDDFGGEKVATLQYKLCVCGKTGRIFRLQLKHENHNCADVRFPESINPCI